MASASNPLPISSLSEPGNFLLVNDTIEASGEFILHHVLAGSLQETEATCVLVSFREPPEHWKAIQSKFGVTLGNYVDRKSFVFVDAFSQFGVPTPLSSPTQDPLVVPPINLDSPVPLRPLYDVITGALRALSPDCPKLLVFDEISMLEWLVPSEVGRARFWRAILALKEKVGFGLVVLQNLDTSHTSTVDFLLSSSTMHLEVSPLSSGRSSAVTGEIALQRGPLSLPDVGTSKTIREHALQYRLTESGAVWIERGTGGGML